MFVFGISIMSGSCINREWDSRGGVRYGRVPDVCWEAEPGCRDGGFHRMIDMERDT